MAKSAARRKPAEQHLELRSELMRRIARSVRESGRTQVEAAAQLAVSQPRLNSLLRGHVELFSLDALVRIAGRAGLNVRLVATRA